MMMSMIIRKVMMMIWDIHKVSRRRSTPPPSNAVQARNVSDHLLDQSGSRRNLTMMMLCVCVRELKKTFEVVEVFVEEVEAVEVAEEGGGVRGKFAEPTFQFVHIL